MSVDQKYTDLIARCDQLIKAGDLSAVHSQMAQTSLSQVPRKFRQSLAKICRRSGLINQGLRLLQPLVRSEKPRDVVATPAEICEYAVLLSRNGSNQEAMELLQTVDQNQTPEASLYLAYSHIIDWEYAEAIPLLIKYLQSPTDEYSKLIAKVNLASSHLAVDQLKEAADVLSEVIPEAEERGASRLVGNCLDLLGHVHFLAENFLEARKVLNQALQYFTQSESYDQLLIYKTLSFIEAFETNSAEPLVRFRKQAFFQQHWGSVREADLYIAKIQRDQKVLDHVVFGTPMPAFRDRVLKEVKMNPSDSYLYGSERGLLFDLQTGKLEGAQLNSGKKIHQTIAALVKDFYVPRNIGTLFAELYPNEYFDINSSRHRVNQLLSRTRAWLEENEVPASVEEQNGTYRLLLRPGIRIRMLLDKPAIESQVVKWAELQQAFASQTSFSAAEACLQLRWTRSMFLRVARWAEENGLLQKFGTGRAILYELRAANHQRSA